MQISFEQSGGFAGLRSSVAVDTSQLSSDEADKVSRMVDEARFFDLPAMITSPRPQPDRYQYMIRIQKEGGQHTVNVSEEAMPPQLHPLVKWLQEEARRQARERKR